MSNINVYLKILNEEKVKDSVVINFGEWFKSIRKICILY